MVIKTKESKSAIKQIIDKKDKTSTKILIGFIVGIMIAVTLASLKQIYACGISNCVLGGAGIGSIIVVFLWLIIDMLKP